MLMSAMSAEWTKLWTTRTVWWALFGAAMLMAAVAAQYAVYVDNGDLAPPETASGLVSGGAVAALAADIAQFALIALAMLVVTSEYSTGTIRSTLTWIPSRGRLLLAKCAVVGAVTFVAGILLGVLGAGAATPLLGERADPAVGSITDHAIHIGLYLAAIGVFAAGLGAAFRGPVITLVTIFLLLVVVPPIVTMPESEAFDRVADLLPGVAGSHFMRGDGDTYPPAVGLLVVAVWAVAAVLAGWRVMSRRDA
jgi:ABC-2 type transport system permease protein